MEYKWADRYDCGGLFMEARKWVGWAATTQFLTNSSVDRLLYLTRTGIMYYTRALRIDYFFSIKRLLSRIYY